MEQDFAIFLVLPVGIEPIVVRLSGGYSAIELQEHWRARQDLNLQPQA